MNLKSFILAFIAIVMMAIPAVAEAPQEVTLTVSSDGPSKEDAIKNALRSAIEQAFGAFVSTNTTILNDEIVKDEIVTVSNGSIKEYKEISAVQTDNGNHFVTLTATVSLPNLITYAKSHGSECEFAGNTFGMEMKLFELQKQNELKALYNLTDQVMALSRNVMKHNLTIGEPRQPTEEDIPLFDEYKYGTKVEAFLKYIGRTGGEYFKAMPWEVILEPLKGYEGSHKGTLNQKAAEYLRQFKDENGIISKFYVVPMTIEWVYEPSNGSSIYEIMNNVFSSLALKESDINVYEAKGINLTCLPFGDFDFDSYHRKVSKYYYFRNSAEDIFKWYYDLFDKLRIESISFVIKDNMGVESSFNPQAIDNRIYKKNYKFGFDRDNRNFPNMYYDDCTLMLNRLPEYGYASEHSKMFGIFGSGIFYNLFKVNRILDIDDSGWPILYPSLNNGNIYFDSESRFRSVNCPPESGRNKYTWNVLAFIPKEAIGKYSKFWIEPKQ